ncbi:MAG: virulence protein RhuM/Fic/DOC family protein [Bacteroidia bacterium]|jgi:prophage maintenance system killer protein|nr:virulence protein RhuM/Fic/DOC family protein [Bacteroidia bacterium]
MKNQIEIYQTSNLQIEIVVSFKNDSVWMSQKMMSLLFEKDSDTIGLHLLNIYKDIELVEKSTTEFFSVVQLEGKRLISRKIKYYNLDAIISVGYRVNSRIGTRFRQWATNRLKEYLVQGYAINERRLLEKQQQVEYLKTGIRILSRAIEEQVNVSDSKSLRIFAKGLTLLEDFDNELLDQSSRTEAKIKYPKLKDYFHLINKMQLSINSKVFAKPKDSSFESSVRLIEQSFNGKEFYIGLEEKAAMLLYLIVKNHSFVDGNKRIGAACFLFFLERNNLLVNKFQQPILSNDALASLTLFVASSRPDEMGTVKKLIISILNRNQL